MPSGDTLVIYATGDVAPDRPDPATCFDHVRAELRRADIAICQLEVNITDRGERAPQARHTHRAAASTGAAMRDAGYSIVSCAGNHCMDWGQVGLRDTLANLRSAGLSVVGAGMNIAEARRPVVAQAKGRKVAVLAYSSILPQGYWAEANRPGCAPMRAYTHYEQIEHDQPGTPARVHTFAHRGDLDAMVEDIHAAKREADVVIVSQHWGIHFIPAVLADYQREVAHAAIDAGADLILGHHAHILKGVEVYRGKTILYSLCNFAMDLKMDEAHANSPGFKEIQSLHPRWIPDFDSLYNFPDDSRMTLIAKAVLDAHSALRVTLKPVFINRQAQPELLKPTDPRFGELVQYLTDMSRAAGLTTRFESVGDEVEALAA